MFRVEVSGLFFFLCVCVCVFFWGSGVRVSGSGLRAWAGAWVAKPPRRDP